VAGVGQRWWLTHCHCSVIMKLFVCPKFKAKLKWAWIAQPRHHLRKCSRARELLWRPHCKGCIFSRFVGARERKSWTQNLKRFRGRTANCNASWIPKSGAKNERLLTWGSRIRWRVITSSINCWSFRYTETTLIYSNEEPITVFRHLQRTEIIFRSSISQKILGEHFRYSFRDHSTAHNMFSIKLIQTYTFCTLRK
jgi:hypothetical protein